jgi:hypothetical protein
MASDASVTSVMRNLVLRMAEEVSRSHERGEQKVRTLFAEGSLAGGPAEALLERLLDAVEELLVDL